MSRFLRRALQLARRGRFGASPNPLVGAVLVREGEAVGEGWHARAGEPHAELEALRAAGARARGATLFLNLEPCAHQGRTPPCAEAVIRAGVARVVACHADPDARVAGRGFALLRAAGVEVEIGALREAAIDLNLSFLTSELLHRPAVTLKWAMSLDGKIATASGESRWISSPAGRRWALELRESHDAILIGSETLLRDDPLLDRRRGRAPGPNLRVVLDRRLRFPETARILGPEGPVRVYTECGDEETVARLERRGVVIVAMRSVEPANVLSDLAELGIRSVLVEGGGGMAGSFVRAGLFDRVEVCCAPLVIGGSEALGPVGGEGFSSLELAPRLEGLRAGSRGPDRILSARRKGAVRELASLLDRTPGG